MDTTPYRLELRSRLELALKRCKARQPDEALLPDVIALVQAMRAVGLTVMPDCEQVLQELPVISELSYSSCTAPGFLANCIARDILFFILAPDAPPETAACTEMFKAIDGGNTESIRKLCASADPNTRYGKYGETALYHAMACSRAPLSPEILSLLLDTGARPQLGLIGCNALHGLGFARILPEDVPELTKIIRRCVALGADLEQPSEKLRWTPLHSALANWNEQAAEALLNAGADPNTGTRESNGCIEMQSLWQIETYQPRLVALLLRHGADPTLFNQQYKSIGGITEKESATASEATADINFSAKLREQLASVDTWQRPN